MDLVRSGFPTTRARAQRHSVRRNARHFSIQSPKGATFDLEIPRLLDAVLVAGKLATRRRAEVECAAFE
jgi:hypothetical protein